MTEQKKELLKLAKGHWQENILFDLLTQKTIVSPIGKQLKGRARNYIGRYEESFYNLLSRLNSAGITVQRTPGPRGGEYSATYKIIS